LERQSISPLRHSATGRDGAVLGHAGIAGTTDGLGGEQRAGHATLDGEIADQSHG
jgi:hypothetical protein